MLNITTFWCKNKYLALMLLLPRTPEKKIRFIWEVCVHFFILGDLEFSTKNVIPPLLNNL